MPQNIIPGIFVSTALGGQYIRTQTDFSNAAREKR